MSRASTNWSAARLSKQSMAASIATRAKIARGNLVRYLAEQQADDLAVVKRFDLGYHYDEQASTNDNLVFVAD